MSFKVGGIPWQNGGSMCQTGDFQTTFCACELQIFLTGFLFVLSTLRPILLNTSLSYSKTWSFSSDIKSFQVPKRPWAVLLHGLMTNESQKEVALLCPIVVSVCMMKLIFFVQKPKSLFLIILKIIKSFQVPKLPWPVLLHGLMTNESQKEVALLCPIVVSVCMMKLIFLCKSQNLCSWSF